MSNHQHGVAGLKQHQMKVSTIVFMIYCLVAAGAFGIEEMISASGPGITLIMLMVFPIIWALPISNIVAEMGAILPSEGGAYVWTREALGEFWGFQAGWWGTVSTYITNGTYVVLVVDYLGKFVTMTDMQSYMVKLAMILIFTFINLMGIREVGAISTLLSMIVLIAFAGVAIVGFMNWGQNPFLPFIADDMTPLEGIGGCIGICIWMYCGYECISNMAGEVKNPEVIPKGLLIAMPLIALTYILPTMGGLASVGDWENWAVSGDGTVGYYSVFSEFLGPAFGVLFLIVAIISQCSIFNTYLASGSRGFFVLADDHLSPKFLVKVSKKRGVPYVGVISLAIVTMFLAQFDFTTLVLCEVVFMLALYIILSISAYILRKKIPVEERKKLGVYTIPGGKIAFNLCCILPFIIAIIAFLINGTDYFLIGLAAATTGPIAYIIIKLIYGGRAKLDAKRYPLNPRTRLAEGDLYRISIYTLATGIFAFIGSFFLTWYEGEWGEEYYLEEYESGFLSNFDGMISSLFYGGIAVIVLGLMILAAGKALEKKKT